MIKKCIKIESGNRKYFGLTPPEWSIALIPTGIYSIILSGSKLFYVALLHVAAIILYVMILRKLEEDIINIVMKNNVISNIVKGIFFEANVFRVKNKGVLHKKKQAVTGKKMEIIRE